MERIERQRQLEEKATEELLFEIDLHIRTRRGWDCRAPTSYRCATSSIQQDPDVQQALADYNSTFHSNLSVGDFILKNMDSFIVENLNMNRVGVRNLTTFQGDPTHRVYGYFECTRQCGRRWQSASTWANKWQKCQSCESRCYPYEQHILLQGDHDDQTESLKSHDRGRCQKCMELGRLCVPGRYYVI